MPARKCLFLLLAAASPALALTLDQSAIQPAPPVLPQGTISAGVETAGSTTDAQFSAFAPVYSDVGSAGVLNGTLVFAEPFATWIERGAIDTGLGLGVRHLFGSQPVSQLKEDSATPAGFLDEGWFIGATLFGDMLERSSGVRYWQMTPGLEIGTRYLELRGHYQIPVTDGETTVVRSTRVFHDFHSNESNGIRFKTQITSTVHSKATLLHESLQGGDLELAALIPGLDNYTELKVIGGYANFHSTTLDRIKYDSWKSGLEWRPVPACVLSAMWYSNEHLVGDHFMYGLRLELPFETADIGDGQGGFWGHIKAAFKPRRRHLAERLEESAHAHQLEPQIAIYPTKISTQIQNQFHTTAILPDGRVITYTSSSARSFTATPVAATGTTAISSSDFSYSAGVTFSAVGPNDPLNTPGPAGGTTFIGFVGNPDPPTTSPGTSSPTSGPP